MKTGSTVWAIALLALAGCAADGSKSPDSGDAALSSTNTAGASDVGAASTPDAGSDAMASRTSQASTSSQGSQASAMGVVQTVDQITRQDAASMGLATGAAAAGGSMGAPTDKVYRVTLRLDDGTTQTVLAESMPGYKSGDRVRYANGTVQRDAQ